MTRKQTLITAGVVGLLAIGVANSATKTTSHPKTAVATQTTTQTPKTAPARPLPTTTVAKPKATPKPKAAELASLMSTCASWKLAGVEAQNALTSGIAGDGTPIQIRITTDIQAYCGRHSGSAVLTLGVPTSDLYPDYSKTYPLAFEESFVSVAQGSGVSASQASSVLDAIEHSVPYSVMVGATHDILTGNPPSWFTFAAQSS